MDNVLFVPSVGATEWAREVLPLISPAELPVAGRRIVDYALEAACRHDVMFSEILDWSFSKKLADDFSELTSSKLPVFYEKGPGSIPRGISEIEGIPTTLTRDIADGLVVVWGLCMPDGEPGKFELEPLSDAELADTPSGVYLRKEGRWMHVVQSVMVIDGVKAWHEINLKILNCPDEFTLPGYSAEEGVHLGRNVVMEHGTDVKKPALLQNGAWCARNVVLGGDVVIGSNAFVGEGTTLRRTVVCDDTFVGEGLDLDGKIVYGNRIIDAESGVWTDVEDEGVASRNGDVSDGVGILRRMWLGLCHFLYGASRGRRR